MVCKLFILSPSFRSTLKLSRLGKSSSYSLRLGNVLDFTFGVNLSLSSSAVERVVGFDNGDK